MHQILSTKCVQYWTKTVEALAEITTLQNKTKKRLNFRFRARHPRKSNRAERQQQKMISEMTYSSRNLKDQRLKKAAKSLIWTSKIGKGR